MRVQDVGLRSEPDLRILEWAAETGRVIVTHDRSTLIGSAYDLIRASEPMSGVIAAAQSVGIGVAIDDLELMTTCSNLEEWQARVSYLPL